jgi:hypothetical protein
VGRITVIVALGISGETTVSSRVSLRLVFMALLGFSEGKISVGLGLSDLDGCMLSCSFDLVVFSSFKYFIMHHISYFNSIKQR